MKPRHIHLIGICGTAMASLAGMLKQRGFLITGSDVAAYPPMSELLAGIGIVVSQPYAEANLSPRPDLVVIGNALSRGNVEVEYVLDQRLPFTSMAALVHEEFLRGREVLTVAGTHGKTTTTSMLSWIFHVAGRQPSFLIGGIAENFGSSFAVTEGREFILEGDEYDTAFFDKGPKFMHYFPDGVILTSVEFDHADIYRSLDEVKTAFKRLVNLVPRRGRVIAWDEQGSAGNRVRALAAAASASALAALSVRSSAMASPRTPPGGFAMCVMSRAALPGRVERHGQPWAEFDFALAGEYNVLNAIAAAALAAGYGIDRGNHWRRPAQLPQREAAPGSESRDRRDYGD